MRGRILLWFLALPLCVAGSQVAHSLAYRFVQPDPVAREKLLATTGHGYLAHAPLAGALATALILAAVVYLALDLRRPDKARLPFWLYALLPPLVFASQELLERFAHDGHFPFGAVLEPTFLPGLLLQLPFSVAAYALARLLVGVTRRLIAPGRGAVPTQARRGTRPPVASQSEAGPSRGSLLGRLYGSRAPPLVA